MSKGHGKNREKPLQHLKLCTRDITFESQEHVYSEERRTSSMPVGTCAERFGNVPRCWFPFSDTGWIAPQGIVRIIHMLVEWRICDLQIARRAIWHVQPLWDHPAKFVADRWLVHQILQIPTGWTALKCPPAVRAIYK